MKKNEKIYELIKEFNNTLTDEQKVQYRIVINEILEEVQKAFAAGYAQAKAECETELKYNVSAQSLSELLEFIDDEIQAVQSNIMNNLSDDPRNRNEMKWLSDTHKYNRRYRKFLIDMEENFFEKLEKKLELKTEEEGEEAPF